MKLAVFGSTGGTGHQLRRREHVCSTAMQGIVPTMRDLHVRRVIATSTFGAGDSRPHVGLLTRTVATFMLAEVQGMAWVHKRPVLQY